MKYFISIFLELIWHGVFERAGSSVASSDQSWMVCSLIDLLALPGIKSPKDMSACYWDEYFSYFG